MSERIELRVSAEEKIHWQAIAASRGVSLSELIRATLSGQRLRVRRSAPRVDPDLVRELARIGNNLNQLARVPQSVGQLNFGIDAGKGFGCHPLLKSIS